MMGAYYFALVDDNGVLCVDQIETEEADPEARVTRLAEAYPKVIYFHYWPGDPGARA